MSAELQNALDEETEHQVILPQQPKSIFDYQKSDVIERSVRHHVTYDVSKELIDKCNDFIEIKPVLL